METVAPQPAGARRAPNVLKTMESAWAQIARRRFLSCLLIVALTLGLRLAILRVDPIPEPKTHDEFAYILGAETLALGRVANPTPLMWRFFETFHVNMQPTYVSKYPPAQSAFLALGIRLFGHPWYGVLISVALMCGSICWMLQGWMPPKFALLGALFAVLQFGVTHYWMESYWGGAVAAMGGALVFGSLPRLARDGKASAAWAGATGIAILANSRPFEGLVLVLLTSATLFWWTRRNFRVWFRPRVISTFVAVLLCTGTAMAYYNLKTTGSAITLAYSINQQRYSASPLFWMMPPYPSKHREYRDPFMREFWESWDLGHYALARRHPPGVVFRLYEKIRELLGDGTGLTLLFLVACAMPLVGIARVRSVLVILVLFLGAMTLNKFVYAHYLAPGLGVFFVAAMFGMRVLRCHRFRGHDIGRVLVASVLALGGVLFFFNSFISLYKRVVIPDTRFTAVSFRRQVAAKLASEPGTHLVLVRYEATHRVHEEIIYNGPDIDSQKIVWACDFGPVADRPLLDYYRGRKVWLVQPDSPGSTLRQYSSD